MSILRYRIKLNMGWEFIVSGNEETMIKNKLENYLDRLVSEDGFTIMAISAKEDLKNGKYTSEEYTGFIVE